MNRIINYIKNDYTMIIVVLLALIICLFSLSIVKDYENKCELKCQEFINKQCPLYSIDTVPQLAKVIPITNNGDDDNEHMEGNSFNP